MPGLGLDSCLALLLASEGLRSFKVPSRLFPPPPTQDVPVKQRRATSASVVQARSPWGDLPADRPPSRQKPPPESLDLFAGGTADPRGLVMELRGGRHRPMTAMAAAGAHGAHGGSRGGIHGGLAQGGGAGTRQRRRPSRCGCAPNVSLRRAAPLVRVRGGFCGGEGVVPIVLTARRALPSPLAASHAGVYRPPTNVVSQRPPPAAAAAAAARLAIPRSVVHRLADDIYHGSDGEHEEE